MSKRPNFDFEDLNKLQKTCALPESQRWLLDTILELETRVQELDRKKALLEIQIKAYRALKGFGMTGKMN